MTATAARTMPGALVAGKAISFVAYGEPVPQGELARNPHGRGMYYPNGKELDAWRLVVAWAARAAARSAGFSAPLGGAFELDVTFWLTRPPSVREGVRPLPWAKPDLQHLVRGLEDSLVKPDRRRPWKAGVIGDDAQITDTNARKRYAAAGARPCSVVSLRPITVL